MACMHEHCAKDKAVFIGAPIQLVVAVNAKLEHRVVGAHAHVGDQRNGGDLEQKWLAVDERFSLLERICSGSSPRNRAEFGQQGRAVGVR